MVISRLMAGNLIWLELLLWSRGLSKKYAPRLPNSMIGIFSVVATTAQSTRDEWCGIRPRSNAIAPTVKAGVIPYCAVRITGGLTHGIKPRYQRLETRIQKQKERKNLLGGRQQRRARNRAKSFLSFGNHTREGSEQTRRLQPSRFSMPW